MLLLLHPLYRHGEQGRCKMKKYYHLVKCPSPAASGHRKIIIMNAVMFKNVLHDLIIN